MFEIKTKRLVLKRPDKSINKKLFASLVGEWDIAKWLSDVPYPYTEKHAEKFIKRSSPDDLRFSVFYDGVLVGGVGVSYEDNNELDIGYWIAKDYWSYGFATEASLGLINYVRSETDFKVITACYVKGNKASAKVLKKLGFIEIGESEQYFLSRKVKMSCIDLILNLDQ
ncbi:GCN5 family acetyltransferase [bacterium]|nr:GCN5 family acetyltransferase [bacterium]